jgi:hypothetical protein
VRRSGWAALAGVAFGVMTACAAEPTPTPVPTSFVSSPPAATTTAPTPSPTLSPTPTQSPEPSFNLALPNGTDDRIVVVTVAPNVGAASGTLTVTVTSSATDRIDELVLRWPTALNDVLFLAPFTPSADRIRDGGPPLNQPWTKWVVGPGEQGEPDSTISLGWGPLLPGATLTIPLIASRTTPDPIAFDLQLLARNELLAFAGGRPAEIRVEVP